MMKNLLASALMGPAPHLVGLVRDLTGRKPDISGKLVVLTGASSGIGAATARLLAEHGAIVIAAARRDDELQSLCAEITAKGGKAYPICCDVTDTNQVDSFARKVLDEFGPPHIVINNAGRSIRRPVWDATDRTHDYVRTMAVNYFGAIQLTLAFLPDMRAAHRGHIINIGTWGTSIEVMPNYSAYHASKAALSAFSRTLGAECHDANIYVTLIGFPLVRTPMITPTQNYDNVPALDPQQAASWILRAIRDRPVEIFPSYAFPLKMLSLISPALVNHVINIVGM